MTMRYYNIHTHRQTDSDQTVEIVNCYPGDKIGDRGYYSLGIHPWYMQDQEKQMCLFKEKTLLPEVVAVGEAGLDKLAASPFPLQQQIFEKQALWAERIRKPLIIHCVKSWSELMVLKKSIQPAMPWIIHGFRGNFRLSEQLLFHGFYLSFSDCFQPGVLRWEISDRIFLETDDKSVAIRDVYIRVALYLNIETELLAERISKNVHHVFSI